MRKYKVNLHLTEACNFQCRYCFAHFEEHQTLLVEEWKHIIDHCYSSGMVDAINFAGGEPLLYTGLIDLVQYAKQKGMKCSLITNASRMDEAWILENAGLFDTIGISMDSFHKKTMQRIGRKDCHGNALTLNLLEDKMRLIKQCHPKVKLKLNTVVNAINQNENMADILLKHQLPIARWKLLKMSPFDDGKHSNADLAVSDQAFFQFVQNNLDAYGISMVVDDVVLYHTHNGMEIVAERELRSGYIMVDAGGYLVDDTQNSSYIRVINCLEQPFMDGLLKLNFTQDLYAARYSEITVHSVRKHTCPLVESA